MRKVYEFISVILHPVFLPTFGSWIYLNNLPLPISKAQIYLIFFIVVGATFLIPLLTIFLLKVTGYIQSIHATTIKERKLPVMLMIANYVFLAQVLADVWQLRELAILAYATALGLIITILFFHKNIKVSLHMLGVSGLLGFAIIYGVSYNYPVVIISLLFVLTGFVATSRLKLKAHNFKEIILGTCFGLFLPILMNLFL